MASKKPTNQVITDQSAQVFRILQDGGFKSNEWLSLTYPRLVWSWKQRVTDLRKELRPRGWDIISEQRDGEPGWRLVQVGTYAEAIRNDEQVPEIDREQVQARLTRPVTSFTEYVEQVEAGLTPEEQSTLEALREHYDTENERLYYNRRAGEAEPWA